jgi:hypothetical protein
VTASGYRAGPGGAQSAGDTNTYLRFGTLTLDGTTRYRAPYRTPRFRTRRGRRCWVQHQLDTAAAGVTTEQYVTRETVTVR